MKLSKAQKEVISRMKEGHILHWVGGLNPRAFMSGDLKAVRFSTIFKLSDLGLIADTKEHKYDPHYRLTDPGKTIEL